jgi:alpha-D-xyloside xylohydrolase
VSKVLVAFRFAAVLFTVASPLTASAQQENKLVLDRAGSTIVVEPYADNIVRVTLSLQRNNALSPSGYGFVGLPTTTH